MGHQSKLETLLVSKGKYLVPNSVRPFLRSVYIKGRFFISDSIERLKLNAYLRRGGTYLGWYADRLDSMTQGTDHSIKPSYIDGTGVVDLECVKRFGLKPHHRLHEFGVGFLRASSFFIDYLDAGKFSGNDASAERIRWGSEHFGRGKIATKQARFIVNTDNSFDWLNGEKVDYVWCNAVIGHLPPEDVDEFFKNSRKLMHKDSMLLVTYSDLDVSRWRDMSEEREKARQVRDFMLTQAGNDVARFTVKDFFYSLPMFQRLGEKYGFVIEDRSDFLPNTDTISFDRWDMLLKCTLK